MFEKAGLLVFNVEKTFPVITRSLLHVCFNISKIAINLIIYITHLTNCNCLINPQVCECLLVNLYLAYMIFLFPSLVLKFPIVLNQYSVYMVSPPYQCKTKCIPIISGFRYYWLLDLVWRSKHSVKSGVVRSMRMI